MEITATRPDPIREAAGSPLGPDGCYFVGAVGYAGQEDLGDWRKAGVLEYNSPPADQPGLWCQWTPTDDGKELVWDKGEKFYCYVGWLEYLIANFLKPWGISLSGEVSWVGEDSDDRGIIYAKDNQIAAVASEIVNSGPPW